MPEPRKNFGRNVTIAPGRVVTPRSEAEVVGILEWCVRESRRVHVVGALHSWSALTDCPDVMLDLRELRDVRILRRAGGPVVQAGAGATIARILSVLARESLTLPSVGAIGRQTIAGAVATATHGSGRQSLSHFVTAMRIACLDGGAGVPAVLEFDETSRPGDLDAARVGLGYVGVVVSVTLTVVAQYRVEESLAMLTSLRDDVLAGADIYPLQQFAVVPYAWRYYTFRRRIRASRPQPGRAPWAAVRAYRAYKLVMVDCLLHGLVKLMAWWSRGPFIRLFYGKLFPALALRDVSVTDRSDRMLMLRHDLYTHLEMEVFVPESHVEQALTLVRHLTEVFAHDGAAPDKLPDQFRLTLKAVPGALERLAEKYGTFTYHYVINCRRVLPESALLATTAGDRVYYTLSFFTFDVGDSEPFLDYCRLLADCLVVLYGARLHWGKCFPLSYENGARVMYGEERMRAFREVCRRYDPRGLMLNRYAREILGFDSQSG